MERRREQNSECDSDILSDFVISLSLILKSQPMLDIFILRTAD